MLSLAMENVFLDLFRPLDDFRFERINFLKHDHLVWTNLTKDFVLYREYSSWQKKMVWRWDKYDQKKFNQSMGNCLGKLSHVGEQRIRSFNTRQDAYHNAVSSLKQFALEEYLQNMDMSLKLETERRFKLIAKTNKHTCFSSVQVVGKHNDWRFAKHNWLYTMPDDFQIEGYKTRKQMLENIYHLITNNFLSFYTEKVYLDLKDTNIKPWWLIFLKDEVKLEQLNIY